MAGWVVHERSEWQYRRKLTGSQNRCSSDVLVCHTEEICASSLASPRSLKEDPENRDRGP